MKNKTIYKRNLGIFLIVILHSLAMLKAQEPFIWLLAGGDNDQYIIESGTTIIFDLLAPYDNIIEFEIVYGDNSFTIQSPPSPHFTYTFYNNEKAIKYASIKALWTYNSTEYDYNVDLILLNNLLPVDASQENILSYSGGTGYFNFLPNDNFDPLECLYFKTNNIIKIHDIDYNNAEQIIHFLYDANEFDFELNDEMVVFQKIGNEIIEIQKISLKQISNSAMVGTGTLNSFWISPGESFDESIAPNSRHLYNVNPLLKNIAGTSQNINIGKDLTFLFESNDNNYTLDFIRIIEDDEGKRLITETVSCPQTFGQADNIRTSVDLDDIDIVGAFCVVSNFTNDMYEASEYTIQLGQFNFPPVLTSITVDVDGQDFYQVDIDPVYNSYGEVSYEISAQKFCYIVNPLNTEDINLELQFSKPMENVEVTITDEEGHDSNATATNIGDGTWQAALPPIPNETIVTGVQYYITIVGTDEEGLSLDSKIITQHTNGNFGPVYLFDTETGASNNTSDNLHILYIGVNQDYSFLPSATINDPATPCEENIFVDFIVQRLVGHNINLKAFVWPADLVAENTASDHPVHWVFTYADGTTEDTYINLEGNVVTWLNYQFQPDKNNGSMELPVEFSYCKRTSDGMSFELYNEDTRVSKTVTLESPKIADGFHSSIIMNRYNNLKTTFIFDFKNREAYRQHMDEIKWSIEQIDYTYSSLSALSFEGQQHSIKNENAKLIPIKLKITFDDGSVFKTSENIYLCGFNAN